MQLGEFTGGIGETGGHVKFDCPAARIGTAHGVQADLYFVESAAVPGKTGDLQGQLAHCILSEIVPVSKNRKRIGSRRTTMVEVQEQVVRAIAVAFACLGDQLRLHITGRRFAAARYGDFYVGLTVGEHRVLDHKFAGGSCCASCKWPEHQRRRAIREGAVDNSVALHRKLVGAAGMVEIQGHEVLAGGRIRSDYGSGKIGDLTVILRMQGNDQQQR